LASTTDFIKSGYNKLNLEQQHITDMQGHS